MKTSIFKRSMALFLALLLCFITFIGSTITPAFAAATQSEVCVLSFPREGDTSYNATWGHGDLNFMGGWHDKATRFLLGHGAKFRKGAKQLLFSAGTAGNGGGECERGRAG